MRAEIAQMQLRCREPAIYQVVPDWSAAPADAIKFQNIVHLQAPLTAKQRLLKRVCLAATWTSAVGVMIAPYLEQTIFVVCATALIAIAAAIVESASGLAVEQPRYLLRQWGWLTEQGGQSHLPGQTAVFQWSDAVNIALADDHLLAEFADGTAFFVTPSDLIDDDWSTLNRWLRNRVIEN